MEVDKIKPTDDNILVKKLANNEEETEAGIVIPESIQEEDKFESFLGEILATGPGRKRNKGSERYPMWVEEGMKICYRQYAGHKIHEEDDCEYWIIKEQDVLCQIVD